MKNSWQSTAKAMIDGKDIESKQAWWKHLIYHILHKSNFYFKPSKIDMGLTHLLRFQKMAVTAMYRYPHPFSEFHCYAYKSNGYGGFYISSYILHFARWEIVLF